MTKEQNEGLKELGFELGSDEDVLWRDVVDKTEIDIDKLEKTLIINKAVKEMAEKKLKESKTKV